MNREPRVPMSESGRTPAGAYGAELTAAFDAFHEAVMRLPSLDVATTEIIRMRCALHHDCRSCQSLRLRGASDAGVDERVIAQVGDVEHSDLSEQHKVAIRIVNAHLVSPREIDDTLRAAAAEHFTREQLVEILLDVSKWSYQKGFVALALDIPLAEGQLSSLDFDSSGKPVITR